MNKQELLKEVEKIKIEFNEKLNKLIEEKIVVSSMKGFEYLNGDSEWVEVTDNYLEYDYYLKKLDYICYGRYDYFTARTGPFTEEERNYDIIFRKLK